MFVAVCICGRGEVACSTALKKSSYIGGRHSIIMDVHMGVGAGHVWRGIAGPGQASYTPCHLLVIIPAQSSASEQPLCF